jgi:hypothetical protein
MRRMRVVLCLLAVGLFLGAVLYNSLQASATIQWSDNFDDGNYDGWTVITGSFSAASFYLEGQNPKNTISHPSDVANGKWNYTIMEDDNHTSNVLFISNGWNQSSYVVSIYGESNTITLEYWDDVTSIDILDTYNPTDLGGLMEYNITRCEGDTITVRRNGAIILTTTNDTITTSTHFIFNCTTPDYIDDVVVSDCEEPTDGTDDCDFWCFWVLVLDQCWGPVFDNWYICTYHIILICIPLIIIVIWWWRRD